MGAALAGSAFEQGAGAAGRAVTDEQRTKLTDDDELRPLPGDVFFLKPRADGAVGVYRGGAGRAREEPFWQLNGVAAVRRASPAHATLDAYISALDRILWVALTPQLKFPSGLAPTVARDPRTCSMTHASVAARTPVEAQLFWLSTSAAPGELRRIERQQQRDARIR